MVDYISSESIKTRGCKKNGKPCKHLKVYEVDTIDDNGKHLIAICTCEEDLCATCIPEFD